MKDKPFTDHVARLHLTTVPRSAKTRAVAERALDLGGHPGLLVRPRGARALYVLAHGAGAGMRHSFMVAIAHALAGQGIATLRWEFPFMAAGKARPDRAEVAEASARAVWNASKRVARGLPRFAGGKSFGGRMTSRAHAAAALDGLAGLIFLGFPLHPPDKPGPRRSDAGERPRAGIERAEHLAQAGGPMLFLQGTRDDLAQLALLEPMVAGLGARATLHLIDRADHGFERSGRKLPEVIDELARTIAAWIDANLDSA
jgi:predicted alpha/beta-hydrolase family hydrolase